MGTVTEKLQLTGIKEFANSNTCCPGVEDQCQGRAPSDILTSESKQLNILNLHSFIHFLYFFIQKQSLPVQLREGFPPFRYFIQKQSLPVQLRIGFPPFRYFIQKQSLPVQLREGYPPFPLFYSSLSLSFYYKNITRYVFITVIMIVASTTSHITKTHHPSVKETYTGHQKMAALPQGQNNLLKSHCDDPHQAFQNTFHIHKCC